MTTELLVRCQRCILPETYPGITFDDAGVCNYCHNYRKVFRAGKQELFEAVAQHKQSSVGQYNCLVALSGGKDSAFTAYYAAKELNLRVLAFTYDNGFMPEQTRRNISNIVEILGLDHVIAKDDIVRQTAPRVLSSWLHRPSPGMISLLCAGCQPSFQNGVARTAREHQIRLILTGGGEPQATHPTFAERLLGAGDAGGRVGKLAKITGLLGQLLRNPWYLTNPRLFRVFFNDFCYRFAPQLPFLEQKRFLYGSRVIELFRFIDYDEPAILSTISRELKWTKPTHTESAHRSDCTIHLVRQYLYAETLRCTKTDDQLSCMIREEMISREDALDRLKKEDVFPDEILSELIRDLGMDLSAVRDALARARSERG